MKLIYDFIKLHACLKLYIIFFIKKWLKRIYKSKPANSIKFL